MGHTLMENRNGLVVDACLTEAMRPCRADCGAAHDRATCGSTDADHARRRQGLRLGQGDQRWRWGGPRGFRTTWAEMPRSPGHAFYDRLQELLQEAGFNVFVEGVCKPYYAPRMGAPSPALSRLRQYVSKAPHRTAY